MGSFQEGGDPSKVPELAGVGVGQEWWWGLLPAKSELILASGTAYCSEKKGTGVMEARHHDWESESSASNPMPFCQHGKGENDLQLRAVHIYDRNVVSIILNY